MNIGIDLDNTIIDFQAAFRAAGCELGFNFPTSIQSKKEIRDFVRKTDDGEISWQKLQGLTYGKFLCSHAKIYPGVKRFLWRAKQAGHRIKIVSHKTEYGHFDQEKTSLRSVAVDFLKSEKIFHEKSGFIDEIIFGSTLEEKVKEIKKQSFDWFIDDLPEVISHIKNIPSLKYALFSSDLNSSKKILNNSRQELSISPQNWSQIDLLVNGIWTDSEIKKLSSQFIDIPIISIEKITRKGNSGVFRLTLSDGSSVKLKIYPIDSNHDRLKSEFNSTTILSHYGIRFIPKPIAKNNDLGIAFYEWIDGDSIIDLTSKEIQRFLNFLSSLYKIKDAPEFEEMPLASAACLSGEDIKKQIQIRLDQFQYPRFEHQKLNKFFNEEFSPFYNKVITWVENNWPVNSSFDRPIKRSDQILSPSDFGFHNAIKAPNDNIFFLDFEYFGWDDPVKLISDFIYHPAMALSEQEKNQWIEGTLKIFGENLVQRFNVSHFLYGLIWCLIILNDYREDVWQRRTFLLDEKTINKSEILENQLNKATILLKQIKREFEINFMKMKSEK